MIAEDTEPAEAEKTLYIQKVIREAFASRGKAVGPADRKMADIRQLVGGGRDYVNKITGLGRRAVSIRFEDGHTGHIVDTGGMVFVQPDDEVLLPMLGSCKVAVADLKMGNESVRCVFHTGFRGEKLPYWLKALTEIGQIDKSVLLARASYSHTEGLIDSIASQMKHLSGQEVKVIDIDASTPVRGTTVDLIMKGNSLGIADLTADKSETVTIPLE